MSTIIRLMDVCIIFYGLNLNSIKINQVQLHFHLFILWDRWCCAVDNISVKLNQHKTLDQFKPFTWMGEKAILIVCVWIYPFNVFEIKTKINKKTNGKKRAILCTSVVVHKNSCWLNQTFMLWPIYMDQE